MSGNPFDDVVDDTYQCIDLFAGTQSFSRPFAEDDRWDVCAVELQEEIEFGGEVIEPDIVADIIDMDIEELPQDPDVILSSPVCKPFSMAAVGHHFSDDYVPTSRVAFDSIAMVKKTLTIVEELEPTYWVVENPRMMLRKFLHRCPGCDRYRVFNPSDLYEYTCTECKEGYLKISEYNDRYDEQTQLSWCQYVDYDDGPMKPTDFFGNVPDSFEYRICHNGADCHVPASRGSKTGTQGKSSDVERAAIPYGLAREMFDAVMNDIGTSTGPDMVESVGD